MKNLETKIVEAIIDELYGRAGFDHWWDQIEQEDVDEIQEELKSLVSRIITNHTK